MNALRRTLYLQSAVWAVAGLSLLVAPRFIVHRLFGQAAMEWAWLRVLGLHAFGLALLMVMVAHRVETMWWWSWAFALVTAGTAVVVLLNAAFGLGPREPSGLWWVFAAIALAFSFGLLSAIFASSREQPFPG